jgi:hypothetical protein
MARTGPVVRVGVGVRARLGGVMVTAVAATAVVLLAGCGARIANLPARGGATPAATASARPEAAAEPAAGSRAGAQALATRLLARLVLPPGGRPVQLQALPPLLRQPPIGYGEANTAYVHRVFLLRQPMTAVQAFVKGHLPAGLRVLSSGKLTHAGGIGMESVSFNPRALPAGIHSAELNTDVVPAAGGGSLMRADAAATWYPVRSAGEHIDPKGYRAAVVSITMLNPGRHTVTGTFTGSRVISRLAGLANGLHAAPDVPTGCPALLASYRIAFIPASGRSPRVAVAPSGCMTVAVAVAGAAQPELWGGAGLIRAATRLLHAASAR